MVVNMAANRIWLEVADNGVAQVVKLALEQMNGAGNEIVLDFSSVARIDAGALRAVADLAVAADANAARIALRGVNVDVYRVLKLMQLTPRFSFLS
jgi:anti-anti-sigma regulatory factor